MFVIKVLNRGRGYVASRILRENVVDVATIEVAMRSMFVMVEPCPICFKQPTSIKTKLYDKMIDMQEQVDAFKVTTYSSISRWNDHIAFSLTFKKAPLRWADSCSI